MDRRPQLSNHVWSVFIRATGSSNHRDLQATFVIDATPPAPSGVLVNPDPRRYLNALPTLSATASDVAPGTVQGVIFHVARAEDSTKLWNWQASTFTVATVGATDLVPTFNAGVWSYTTDYFQINTGTGTWEQGKGYVVHEVVTDKAGNFSDTAHPGFTFDITAPTATVAIPVLASTPAITSLPSISGATLDNFVASNVQIALQRQASSGLWFDGFQFRFGRAARISYRSRHSPRMPPVGRSPRLAI